VPVPAETHGKIKRHAIEERHRGSVGSGLGGWAMKGKRGGTGLAAVAATRRIGLPVRAATADVLNPRCFAGLRNGTVQRMVVGETSLRWGFSHGKWLLRRRY
jgi:hypothetical protein